MAEPTTIHGHRNGIRGHSGVLTPRCEVLRRFRASAGAASENAHGAPSPTCSMVRLATFGS